MCSLGSALYFVSLRAEENTLLGWLILLRLRHWVGCATLVADCRVDSESSIDITTGLIELYSLPGVFSGLRYLLVFINWSSTCGLRLLLILLRIDLDISFNMIFTEPQWQIEFKRVILATLWLLESCGIWGCSPRPAIGCPAGIRWIVVVRRSICGCCCCGGEEASLGPCLVWRCIHLILDVSWLSDRVGQLYYEIIIEMVFIWGLRLFSNPWPDNLTLSSVSSPWISRSCWDCWWRCVLETVFSFVFNCISVSSCFWDLWATFTLFRSLSGTNLNCVGLRLLLIYLHGLV